MKTFLFSLLAVLAAGIFLFSYISHRASANLTIGYSKPEDSDRRAKKQEPAISPPRIAEQKGEQNGLEPTHDPEMPTRTLADSEKLAGVSERKKKAIQSVQRIYGEVLPALNLPAEVTERLRSALVERFETASDVRDVAREKGWDNSGSLRKATLASVGKVDDEIRELVGETAFPRVHKMIEAEPYLTTVQFRYSPGFRTAGYPLASEQLLDLAIAFSEASDAANKPEAQEWLSESPAMSALDLIDRDILKRVSNTLSQEQLKLLSASLSARHHPPSSK